MAGRTTFTVLADRQRNLPWGLEGGRPGAGTRVAVVRNGKRAQISVKSTLSLARGDVVEILTAGGGGYGDPSARPKRSIDRDMRNGLLSAGRAKLDYRPRRSG